MKLFMVEEFRCPHDFIVRGVFSSHSKAKNFIDTIEQNSYSSSFDTFSIIETKLDEEIGPQEPSVIEGTLAEEPPLLSA